MLMRTNAERCGRNVISALAIVLALTTATLADSVGGVVKLPPDRVLASGISVASLKASRYVHEVQGVATVLDPQRLIAASARLVAARENQAAAAQQTSAAAAEAKRSQQRPRQMGKHVGDVGGTRPRGVGGLRGRSRGTARRGHAGEQRPSVVG